MSSTVVSLVWQYWQLAPSIPIFCWHQLKKFRRSNWTTVWTKESEQCSTAIRHVPYLLACPQLCPKDRTTCRCLEVSFLANPCRSSCRTRPRAWQSTRASESGRSCNKRLIQVLNNIYQTLYILEVSAPPAVTPKVLGVVLEGHFLA